MSKIELVCDVLDNQRKLTKWYIKKIPAEILNERIAIGDKFLNSPLWQVSHLIWTDYYLGLLPLGFKGEQPKWLQQVGFGSNGVLPKEAPSSSSILDLFDEVNEERLKFYRTFDETKLYETYPLSHLKFKNIYYALLHLARHEGVHTGNIAVFCKMKGYKTI